MPQSEQVGAEARHITIEVNHQPVRMAGDDATGLQIKEAAIAQGVRIDLDFVLSRKHGDKWIVVADEEHLELRKGEEFNATAPDDNS